MLKMTAYVIDGAASKTRQIMVKKQKTKTTLYEVLRCTINVYKKLTNDNEEEHLYEHE